MNFAVLVTCALFPLKSEEFRTRIGMIWIVLKVNILSCTKSVLINTYGQYVVEVLVSEKVYSQLDKIQDTAK